MSDLPRPRASFLPFLVTAVVIGLLALVLMPVVSNMREAGRRAQCINHLRQLALAVREYHDAQNQLPPLATDEGHWTWVALVLPHLPDAKGHEGLDILSPASAEANRARVEQFRLPGLYCPSRRSEAPEPDGLPGQPTDYVAVSTTLQLFWSTSSNGSIVLRAEPPTKDRPARSVTSLAHLTDGQSTTALLGEKRMQRAWLWGQFDKAALVAHHDPNTIRIASNIEGDDRAIVEVERGLAGDDEADDDAYKFGGPHPGVCFFAMADASVRPIKNSTDPRHPALALRPQRWISSRADRVSLLKRHAHGCSKEAGWSHRGGHPACVEIDSRQIDRAAPRASTALAEAGVEPARGLLPRGF